MLVKVTYAGARSASFKQATEDLKTLAEVEVSRERVQRWTKRIGNERVDQIEEQAKAYQELPLPDRRCSPVDQVPQVACVQMDGGRIQIRDRREGPDKRKAKGYWRESLVGCCLSMTSEEHPADPCPRIPKTFVDPERMNELSRGIKGFPGDTEAVEDSPPDSPDDRVGRPEVLVKSVVTTRKGIDVFGKRLIAVAHARGFNAAKRKAFVADGLATNWSVHRQHFSHYTPILDFTHAICYVYAAALAGRSRPIGWQMYCQWAQWLWEGAIDRLIAAVKVRSEELGLPSAGDETSSAAIVFRTLGYLTNQRTRMQYDRYRKLGLPITSSHIESTIKQVNRRMKGTEKFWHQGAEPLLGLIGDHLSETSDLRQFWRNRRTRIQPMRCYRTAA